MRFRKRSLAKSPKDIEGMRVSGRFNAELMLYIRDFVKEGVSTQYLNDVVHEYTVRHGHIPAPLGYHGFPRSICTSINEVVCHGIPSEQEILKDGDIVNVDITSIVNGYFGDLSETFLIGNVSAEAKKLSQVSREALYIGIKAIKPGRLLYDVVAEVEDHIKKHDFSVVWQFTGHGIGKNFHEEPQVPHHRDPATKRVVLEAGMTFTLEPMVNQGSPDTLVLSDNWTAITSDGKLSAQWEHTILVTPSGADILTEHPDERHLRP